jgi:hypothetical protein
MDRHILLIDTRATAYNSLGCFRSSQMDRSWFDNKLIPRSLHVTFYSAEFEAPRAPFVGKLHIEVHLRNVLAVAESQRKLAIPIALCLRRVLAS